MDRLPNKDRKDYDFPPVKRSGFLERNSAVLVALVGLILFIVVAKYDILVEFGLSEDSSIALRLVILVISVYVGTVQALYWFNNQDKNKSLREWFHSLYKYSDIRFAITGLSIVSWAVVIVLLARLVITL